MFGYIHHYFPDGEEKKSGLGRYYEALRADVKGRGDVEFFGLDLHRAENTKRNFLEFFQWAKAGWKNTAVGCCDLIPLLDDEFSDSRDMFQSHFNGFKAMDMVMTCSEWVKQTMVDMLHIPAERIQVQLLGFDHELFRPLDWTAAQKLAWRIQHGINTDATVFGHVSYAYPRKNIRRILEAMKDFPDAVFVKVGRDETTMRMAEEMNLQKRVIVLPFLSEMELVGFYNAIDVFVFPSLIEGFGLPPLEAAACGCRVVGSGTTALDEVLSPHDIRVMNPYSVDEIGEGMAIAAGLGRPVPDQNHLAKFNWRNTSRAVGDWLS